MQQQPNIIGFNRESLGSPEIETLMGKDDVVMTSHFHGQATPPLVPRRHIISFNPRVAVKETIHRNDFSPEEISRSWYKKEDFQKMKLAFTHVVQLFAAGRYPGDNDQMTLRGLEYRHREGALRRKTNKLNALYAVLDEQERQWRDGFESDEKIRAIYLTHSTHCSHAAHVMGKQDEAECLRINDCPPTLVAEDDAMSISSDGSTSGSKTTSSKRKTALQRFFNKETSVPSVC